MRSWKTTVCGISAVIAAIAGALGLMFDGNPATNPDWTATIAAITAGIGVIFSKDYNVGSTTVTNLPK